MSKFAFGTNLALAAAVLLVTLNSCTNDKALLGESVTTGTFYQIAREGKPLAIELFTPWVDHSYILTNGPQVDPCPGRLCTDVGTFMTQTAGRSAAISTFVQDVIADPAPMPPAQWPTESDVLVADISVQGTASYLGVELGDRVLPTGLVNPHPSQTFGGRGLPDDVAAISLGLAFGSLVPKITTIPDDGKEKDGRDGRPNLANDNVTSLSQPYPKHYQIGYPYAPLQFPYLGAAI